MERDVVATRRLDSESSRNSSSTVSENQTHQQRLSMADVEALDRLAEHMQKHELIPKPRITWLQRYFQLITGTGNTVEATFEDGIGGKYEYVQTVEFKAIRSRPIFEQTAPRFSIDVDYDEAFRSAHGIENLRQQLSGTRSSAVEFWQKFTSTDHAEAGVKISSLVEPFFQIVFRDSFNLLKVLNDSLDEINLEILDDVKMEERLTMWRQLITRAQLELPDLKLSTSQFVSFLQSLDPLNSDHSGENSHEAPDSTEPQTLSQQLEEFCLEIDGMMLRLQAASSSLTSNMALLDSRRSISEAQAVTKLTELAFFFIPLGFAASLFGMQVEEFENRAPLWTFIAIGLGFVVAAYLVRLLIRSTWLRYLIQKCQSSIRVYADSKRHTVQRGNIPASLFISWASSKIYGGITTGVSSSKSYLATFWDSTEFVIRMLLIILIFAGAPIAVLWTRKLDHGIQIMITIVVLVCVIGLFAVPYWRYTDPETRNALPRMLKKTFDSPTPFGLTVLYFNLLERLPLTLIIVLCVLTILVVPLALIWTRPIAPGIRVAMTIVIIFLFLLGLIIRGLYRLISFARIPLSSSGSESFMIADD